MLYVVHKRYFPYGAGIKVQKDARLNYAGNGTDYAAFRQSRPKCKSAHKASCSRCDDRAPWKARWYAVGDSCHPSGKPAGLRKFRRLRADWEQPQTAA